MLPKHHRLTRSKDFVRVRRFGRSSGTGLLALYALPTRTPDVRVGFSVSKRIGKAVIRNRVKRLMREAVRHQLPDVRPGQDLVFIARPASAGASYPEIFQAVTVALRKTGAVRAAAHAGHNA
jgi:ribonuclease P protein component